MRQIFWGMLFLFLDFNLNLGSSSIGLIPDFAGCIFLIRGLDALAGESVRFVQARPWAVATAAYTGITWTLDLLGIHLGIFSLVLGLGNLALCVYLSWLIVQGILQTEQSKGCQPGRANAAAGLAGGSHRGGAQLSAGLYPGAQLAVHTGRAGLHHLVFVGAVPLPETL